MRFIKVSKYLWILEAIKLLCCLHSLFNKKATFRLEFNANKAVIFSPSKFTDPLNSGPQARNSWLSRENDVRKP